MRSALIGFSSPIGYHYRRPADQSQNDLSDSPNPILMGSMGLFALYDEIWFACESLCPQAMRGLDYVHFLDQEYTKLTPGSDIVDAEKYTVFPGTAGINDLFDGGYKDMQSFVGEREGIDNHTHALQFLDARLSGNPGRSQLSSDIWLLQNTTDRLFDLVLNPITSKICY